MAVLPTPHSVKLHSNFPVFNRRTVTSERKSMTHVVAASTIATKPSTSTSYRPQQVLQLNHNTMFDGLFLGPITDRKFTFSESKSATTDDEGLVKEVGIIMQRLERVADRMREMELEKLKSRIKGEISHEESILVENMSREIVSSFLVKPIGYLKSSDGKLEDKLKDLNCLVGLLEQSYVKKENHA